MLDELKAQLRRDEDERAKPYQDTRGKLTIGVGHNLTDKPISQRAIDMILDDDVNDVTASLDAVLPWWRSLDEARQGVLANMAFNLGVAGLLQFRNTLALVKAGDYAAAAQEMLNSEWAKEVGPRALRLAQQMRSGAWQ